ncbi:MAG: hypothetical protein WBE76_04605 [Terracidiphilus sp.]
MLDLARAVTFFLSILSLYWVMLSAFFVPGSRWQERLAACLVRVTVAACICLASGLLFAWRPRLSGKEAVSPTATLPMRLFFWGLAGMAVLFALSWYIEEYYLPFALKG